MAIEVRNINITDLTNTPQGPQPVPLDATADQRSNIGDKRNLGQLLAGGPAYILTVAADGSFNSRYLDSSFSAISASNMGQTTICWIAGK
jgi:hypothetical protein